MTIFCKRVAIQFPKDLPSLAFKAVCTTIAAPDECFRDLLKKVNSTFESQVIQHVK